MFAARVYVTVTSNPDYFNGTESMSPADAVMFMSVQNTRAAFELQQLERSGFTVALDEGDGADTMYRAEKQFSTVTEAENAARAAGAAGRTMDWIGADDELLDTLEL